MSIRHLTVTHYIIPLKLYIKITSNQPQVRILLSLLIHLSLIENTHWKGRRKMYFKKCPYCRALLDPGEKCDCREKITKYSSLLSIKESGQMEFDFNLIKKKEPVA